VEIESKQMEADSGLYTIRVEEILIRMVLGGKTLQLDFLEGQCKLCMLLLGVHDL